MSNISKGLTIFCTLFLTICYLGYFCQKNNVYELSIFDRDFIISFLFGVTINYIVSDSINNMVLNNNKNMMTYL